MDFKRCLKEQRKLWKLIKKITETVKQLKIGNLINFQEIPIWLRSP